MFTSNMAPAIARSVLQKKQPHENKQTHSKQLVQTFPTNVYLHIGRRGTWTTAEEANGRAESEKPWIKDTSLSLEKSARIRCSRHSRHGGRGCCTSASIRSPASGGGGGMRRESCGVNQKKKKVEKNAVLFHLIFIHPSTKADVSVFQWLPTIGNLKINNVVSFSFVWEN